MHWPPFQMFQQFLSGCLKQRRPWGKVCFENGTLLVAKASILKMLTCHRTGGKIAFQFSEGHSHATDHVVHLPSELEDPGGWFRDCSQFVVVDDEATTGRTAEGLIEAYREWRGPGPEQDYRLAVVLHWNQNGISQRDTFRVSSIVEGKFDVEVKDDFTAPPPPQLRDESEPECRRGLRHGVTHPQSLPPEWEVISAELGENILVVGSGEFGFQPLLLAEHLERQGAKVAIQSTTRSPILPGGAISSARHFPPFSGKGFIEHLYNVPSDHSYDRIYLCVEGPPPDPTHPIWEIPKIVSCPLRVEN